ncbi:MAG TPA: hypothetical protein VES60_16740 [Nakamurella sp.]|nr:hypothetical protein [Nakamurella sp.]
MGFLAGVAVAGLINGRQLTTTGWICISCFLLIIPAGIRIVRIVRIGRPRSGNDGPMM